jgi:hypothetical protein
MINWHERPQHWEPAQRMINWHERPRACGTNVNEDAFRFSYCRHVRHCGRAYGEHLSGCTPTKGQNGRAVVCISARLYQGQQPGRRSALAPVESRLDEAPCACAHAFGQPSQAPSAIFGAPGRLIHRLFRHRPALYFPHSKGSSLEISGA